MVAATELQDDLAQAMINDGLLDMGALKPSAANLPVKPKKARKGEVIGGGFFIFRRHRNSHRISPGLMPFEHPTVAAASEEAERLAHMYPGQVFEVFGSLGAVVQAEAV
jgi:hypothetical protein